MNGRDSETERTDYKYSDVSVQLCEVSLVSDLLRSATEKMRDKEAIRKRWEI